MAGAFTWLNGVGPLLLIAAIILDGNGLLFIRYGLKPS